MIILPKYCCKCGEPLNENFTCDYCGEETIYPQSACKNTRKQKEGPTPTKYIKLLVIALFAIFAIATIVKFVSLKKSDAPTNDSNSNNLVVAVTDTPKPTIEPTLAPTVLSTSAITAIVVTDTPKPTMKPTPIATKKAKRAKKEKIIKTPEIINEPEPIIVTPNPTVVHIYADSISIPDMIVVKGSTVQLAISISPSNAEYSVSSSNSNIASVSGKSVKGNSVGTAMITVTSGSKRATCKITVTNN